MKHTSRTTSDNTTQDASNSVNLGIKGIIGVQVMSEISKAVGSDADASSYSVSLLLVSGVEARAQCHARTANRLDITGALAQ